MSNEPAINTAGGNPVQITGSDDPIRSAIVDPAVINEFISHIREPFMDAMASVTKQGREDMVRYADFILPEMARLELIVQFAPDASIKALAQRHLDHLKVQSIADAARFGVSIIQSSQQAAIAAINTVFIFARRFIGIA